MPSLFRRFYKPLIVVDLVEVLINDEPRLDNEKFALTKIQVETFHDQKINGFVFITWPTEDFGAYQDASTMRAIYILEDRSAYGMKVVYSKATEWAKVPEGDKNAGLPFANDGYHAAALHIVELIRRSLECSPKR